MYFAFSLNKILSTWWCLFYVSDDEG